VTVAVPSSAQDSYMLPIPWAHARILEGLRLPARRRPVWVWEPEASGFTRTHTGRLGRLARVV